MAAETLLAYDHSRTRTTYPRSFVGIDAVASFSHLFKEVDGIYAEAFLRPPMDTAEGRAFWEAKRRYLRELESHPTPWEAVKDLLGNSTVGRLHLGDSDYFLPAIAALTLRFAERLNIDSGMEMRTKGVGLVDDNEGEKIKVVYTDSRDVWSVDAEFPYADPNDELAQRKLKKSLEGSMMAAAGRARRHIDHSGALYAAAAQQDPHPPFYGEYRRVQPGYDPVPRGLVKILWRRQPENPPGEIRRIG